MADREWLGSMTDEDAEAWYVTEDGKSPAATSKMAEAYISTDEDYFGEGGFVFIDEDGGETFVTYPSRVRENQDAETAHLMPFDIGDVDRFLAYGMEKFESWLTER